MRLRLSVAVCALLTALVAVTRAQLQEGDLFTLDVSVVDRKGRPVEGLTAADFSIKDDGRPVAVTTFTAATPADPEVARSIVLFLDDVAMPYASVDPVKAIAQTFLANVGGRDEFAVVRLSRRNDEPFGDRAEATYRIQTYRPGSEPFSDGFTPSVALRRIATIAQQLQSLEQRRKIIVCIGAPIICNAFEPFPASFQWPAWSEVVTATAQANVSVYSIVPGQVRRRGGSLADITGGTMFTGNNNLGPAVAQILDDANHYYLLGYWTSPRGRGLRRVEVKVARKDVVVRARQRRGA